MCIPFLKVIYLFIYQLVSGCTVTPKGTGHHSVFLVHLLMILMIQSISKGGDFPSPKSPSDLLNYCTKTSDTNKWACAVCGQFSHSRRYLVRNHVESKHFPASFEYHCEICHKICNTKKGLEVHIFERHRSHNATI